MAKPNNTSSEKFLEKRRQAIADMAKKRMHKQTTQESRVSLADASGKVAGPVAVRGVSPPTQR